VNLNRNTYNSSESEPNGAGEILATVKKAVAGDHAAFGILYREYVNKIYRYVYYQVQNKMMAEDITGEVFIKAMKAISTCKGKEDTFSAWLYRIAHNTAVDHSRSEKRYFDLAAKMPVTEQNPNDTAEIMLEHRELLGELAGLSPSYRQLIILKFIEGMDNNEISRVMKKSVGAIRVMQLRALKDLRQKCDRGHFE
jgi:RNA polymerase sigma-70 factor, ECF subfamily